MNWRRREMRNDIWWKRPYSAIYGAAYKLIKPPLEVQFQTTYPIRLSALAYHELTWPKLAIAKSNLIQNITS